MPDHVQPTAEEIKAQLDQTIADLDKPETPDPEDNKEDTADEVVTPPEKADDSTEDTDTVKEDTAPDKVETKPDEVTPEKKDDVTPPDTETRYKESSKEARKLKEDNDIVNQAIREANGLPAPTEDELKKEYGDSEYDLMSDTEKRLASDNYMNKRKFDLIAQAEDKRHVVEEWSENIDTYIENPKTLLANPELEGKEDAFKEYAKRKEFRGNNLNLIVGSFITDQTRLGKEKQNANKGKQMETGKGGDKVPVKKTEDKVSPADAAILMKTDFNKWKQLLQEGKLATE